MKVIKITKEYQGGTIEHFLALVDVPDSIEEINEIAEEWCANDPAGQNYGYSCNWRFTEDAVVIDMTLHEKLISVNYQIAQLQIMKHKLLEYFTTKGLVLLSEVDLEKLLVDTGSFYDCPTDEDKQRMRDAYRVVEVETNQQIAEAGGMVAWYEGGRGRVIPDDVKVNLAQPVISPEDGYPTLPTVQFTEDDWTTIHRGKCIDSTPLFYKVDGDGYGVFWIPKENVRIIN